MALRGIVTTFDPKLRYGWVLGEDSVDYYVHTADVEGPRLVAGCHVQFNPGWPKVLCCLRCGKPRVATWAGDLLHQACRDAIPDL